MNILFEWDEAKNRGNQRKHGVSFELASEIFLDPHQVAFIERIVDGEERWQTLGVAAGVPLLMVAHTTREVLNDVKQLEIIRIISARPADLKEKRTYEIQNR